MVQYMHVDTRQMKSPMAYSESLIAQWKYCGLVGTMNQICLCCITFVLVIFALTIPFGFPYCEYDECQKMCEIYHSVERHTSMLATAWMSITFIYLLLAFLIKMIFVNNSLTSTNIPTDGSKVKSWLRWHTHLFLIPVIALVGIYLKGRNHSNEDKYYYYLPILILYITMIVLILEIKVVRKFNKEFDISADGLRRGYKETSSLNI